MKLHQRQIGDAVVIDLRGSIVDFDHDNAIFEGVKAGLSAGNRKFVLNVEGVPYINSIGLGALVRAFWTVHRAGGVLCLSQLTKPIADLLSITTLLRVIEPFNSVDEALVDLGTIRVQTTCPRCGPDSWMRLAETYEYQCCPVCAMQFKVTYVVPFLGELRAAHVPAFRLPTYDGESVDVIVGTPSILVINGRLDLFASETVEQAIALLPRPRQVVCKPGTPDITPSGFDALLRLCHASRDDSRLAISIEGLPSAVKEQQLDLQDSAVHERNEPAFEAVRSEKTAPQLTVTFRRADL
jgi:anti-sigma B factor antagonist